MYNSTLPVGEITTVCFLGPDDTGFKYRDICIFHDIS